MAECYRMMNSTKKAEANYRRIIKSDFARRNPIVYLYYENAVRRNTTLQKIITPCMPKTYLKMFAGPTG